MSSGDDESTTEGESSQRSIAESTADGRERGRGRGEEREGGQMAVELQRAGQGVPSPILNLPISQNS